MRLKDEYSEINDYYNMMFTKLSQYEVSEEDTHVNLGTMFNDRPTMATQLNPADNIYI